MVRTHNPSVLVLAETKVPSSQAFQFLSATQFDCHVFSEPHGFSAGLWVFWKSKDINLVPIVVDAKIITLLVLDHDKVNGLCPQFILLPEAHSATHCGGMLGRWHM